MNRGHKVKPLSIKVIRNTAQGIKDLLKIKDAKVPIVYLLEWLHEHGVIELEIETKNVMPNDYGLTYPQQNKIVLREDVYDDAVIGGGFGRFTLAHELAHYVLHKNESVYARNEHGGVHKTYEDSEWQADKFAQELLADTRFINAHDTVGDLETRFGLSRKAAIVTERALRKEKIITPSFATRGSK